MLKNLFKKKSKYSTLSPIKRETTIQRDSVLKRSGVPDDMWIKCDTCGNLIYKKDFEELNKVCSKCEKHFRINARERVKIIADRGSFKELFKNIKSENPLNFDGYEQKIEKLRKKTGLNEAVLTGEMKINGLDTVVVIMDSTFMMGSMGSAVGEKITKAVEHATKKSLPVIIFTSSGGARMQEGIFSLMQMGKTSFALSRHAEAGNLYITVLTDPTTGGVTASFGMLGDIILAEPGTLIGFAGQRVIEQTIRQRLPEGFQRAEFLLEHGFVDRIVKRDDMKFELGRILKMHGRN